MSTQQLTTPTPDLTGVFSVHGTGTINRRTQLQQLFLQNYSTLREAVQDAGPSLFVPDFDRILEGLSERISAYHGPVGGFVEWAVNVAQDSAHVAETFLAIRNDPENQESVRKAIGSILAGCSELGVDEGTLDDLEHDFWCKVLQELPEWLMPSWSKDGKRPPARLSTRLFGAAMWHARAFKTTRVREKSRHTELPGHESEEKCE